jgi:hypothetical protein
VLGTFRIPGPVCVWLVRVVMAVVIGNVHVNHCAFVAGTSLRGRLSFSPRRQFVLVATLLDHTQQSWIEPIRN